MTTAIDVNHEVPHQDFLQDVIEGLSAPNKTLPCKYFYDKTGSELFEAICTLDEYYITRTELAIIKQYRADIAQHMGQGVTIIEPGSGAGKKVQLLLEACDQPVAFIPIDISPTILDASLSVMQQRFPQLNLHALAGDFTQEESIAELSAIVSQYPKRVLFFPGSTLGNFSRTEAQAILLNFAQLVGQQGHIIIGIDLCIEYRSKPKYASSVHQISMLGSNSAAPSPVNTFANSLISSLS